MPMVSLREPLFLLGLALTLAGCTTADPGQGLEDNAETLTRPPSSVSDPQAEPAGKTAKYCPQITIREGTGILRKELSGEVDYIAAITGTTRNCRIVDGRFLMDITIRGRVTPGPVAETREIPIPIRVAILRDRSVAYSKLGERTVEISADAGVRTFTYADRDIDVGEAGQDNLTIFAGFDEGPGD